MTTSFQRNLTRPLLQWWHKNGRKDLPWQESPSIYKTWVSEIMLQQTQVITVIPYFKKFIKAFPSVTSLADATGDQVMSHWSGLGFYSRARNLHQSSKIIVDQYKGEIPKRFEELIALPGIGTSTAGAILSLSSIEPRPILDGNVKRVLTRFFNISGDLKLSKTNNKLWSLAIGCLPETDYSFYTQAIMDLGATICTSKKTQCPICPVKKNCIAFEKNLVSLLPTKTIKKKKPKQTVFFLILKDQDNNILLEKRENKGIWGGLWSFPELDTNKNIEQWCNKVSQDIKNIEYGTIINHGFSHFDLEITPVVIDIKDTMSLEEHHGRFTKKQISKLGVPKPVKSLINQLK